MQLPAQARGGKNVATEGDGQVNEDAGGELPRIVLLYASPLTREVNDSTEGVAENDTSTQQRLVELPALDVASESSFLLETFRVAQRQVLVNVAVATDDNLLSSVRRNARIIHYAGHGLPNGLGFENGIGGLRELSTTELRDILTHPSTLQNGMSMAGVQLAFVSACHSQGAGEVFCEAGVPHVVAVRWDAQVTDTASRRFAHSFYLALAVGHTVREAFNKGQAAVVTTPGISADSLARQGNKFMLLPEDGNHDVKVLDDLPVGLPIDNSPPMPTSYCNLVPHPFLGRLLIMQELVKKLSPYTLDTANSSKCENKLKFTNSISSATRSANVVDTPSESESKSDCDRYWISLVGTRHVGRASCASSVCAYFSLRRMVDVVYSVSLYFDAKSLDSEASTEANILQAIRESVSLDDPLANVRNVSDISAQLVRGSNFIMVIQMIGELNTIQTKSCRLFLETVLQTVPNLHLMVITDTKLGGEREHVVLVEPLGTEHAAKLFLELYPLSLMAGTGLLNSLLPGILQEDGSVVVQDVIQALSRHKLIKILGGLPPLIVEVATFSRDNLIGNESELLQVATDLSGKYVTDQNQDVSDIGSDQDNNLSPLNLAGFQRFGTTAPAHQRLQHHFSSWNEGLEQPSGAATQDNSVRLPRTLQHRSSAPVFPATTSQTMAASCNTLPLFPSNQTGCANSTPPHPSSIQSHPLTSPAAVPSLPSNQHEGTGSDVSLAAWSSVWERCKNSVNGTVTWPSLVSQLQQEFCRELYMTGGSDDNWTYPPPGLETRVLSYDDLDILRRKLTGRVNAGDDGHLAISAHELSKFWEWFSAVLSTLRREVVAWSAKVNAPGKSTQRVVHFLSKAAAVNMLKGYPVGTFLIRVSENNPGCLALSMVVGSGTVAHSLVRPVRDGGYHVSLSSGPVVFPDLSSVLQGCEFLTTLWPGVEKTNLIETIGSVQF